MKFQFKNLISLPGIFVLLSCAGGPNSSPAIAPAPIAEIPSAIQFPESVAINVDKIRASDSSTSSLKALKAVVGGGEFSDEISGGAEVARLVSLIADERLQPLHKFRIPANKDVKNFKALAIVKDRFVSFKIDFSDFDFDGDGAMEGCSEHTAALPICFRVWANGKRRLAGVFDAFPTNDNPGAGRYRALGFDSSDSLENKVGPIGVIYDHRDPKNKLTELFISSLVKDTDIFVSIHDRLTQTGPAETALKTINGTSNITVTNGNDIEGTGFTHYLGRWKEGEENDLWSGSRQSEATMDEFSHVCARISTGEEESRSECIKLEIDVDDIPFVDFAQDSDAQLPADFPERPTF